MQRDLLRPDPCSITVTLTPSLERLLVKAAGDRGQTAEALVKQVLYDWLLADRGVVRQGNSSTPHQTSGSAALRQ